LLLFPKKEALPSSVPSLDGAENWRDEQGKI
jgi:hypothetical protein